MRQLIIVLALCLFAALSTCQGAGDFKLNHRQLRALKTSFSEKLMAASTKKSDGKLLFNIREKQQCFEFDLA